MKTYKKTALAVMGLSAVLASGWASAAQVTQIGTSVTYRYDDADLVGYFGTASLDGDELVFTADANNRFEAAAANNDSILVPWTLHVKVTANAGYQLTSFNLAEGGSYTLGSLDDYVDVSGVFGLRDADDTNGNYLPVSFGASSALDAVGTPASWTAVANVALPAAGWDTASVNLIVTNQLIADAISSASIAKEYVRVSAIATPVPEAETYAMLLAGLGLVGFMARRGARMAV